MRPVVPDKGGKDTYPYDRNSDLKKTFWTFKTGTNARKYFKKAAVPIADCLAVMVEIAKYNQNQLGVLTATEQAEIDAKLTCADGITNKIDVYRQATAPLMDNLGSFCSFCEIPVLSDFDVEHVAPKSQYPSYSILWENLLISCKPCNQGGAKGENPTRSFVVSDWLNDVEPTDESGYYDEIRKRHYIWPDRDQIAYRAMIPRLGFHDGTGWQLIPEATSIDTRQTYYVSIMSKREVYANIFVSAKAKKTERKRVIVILTAEDTAGFTSSVAATEMIDLCRLNTWRTGDSPKFDRRMVFRTKTWFTALGQLRTLRNAQANSPAEFDDAWTAMLDVASTAGFYSVWVRVFDLGADTDPNGKLYVARFVEDTDDAGRFPNTRTSKVP